MTSSDRLPALVISVAMYCNLLITFRIWLQCAPRHSHAWLLVSSVYHFAACGSIAI